MMLFIYSTMKITLEIKKIIFIEQILYQMLELIINKMNTRHLKTKHSYYDGNRKSYFIITNSK